MFARLFKLSRAEASKRADELLERFDLADAADRPARTYSGGMRRRLDLASSLVTRPQVLFLDEPTTGLDPRSRIEIWASLRELRREGTTLLLTTQYLEEADELADRIAVIDHGRVIAEGTGSELKDRVGGQLLEVELTDVADRERACKALAARRLPRPRAGRAAEPADAPRPGGRPGTDRGRRGGPAPSQIRVSDIGAAPPDARRRLPAADGCAGRARTAVRRRAPPPHRRARRAHGRGSGWSSRRRAPGAATSPTLRSSHGPQPAPLHPRTAAADLLDDPAGHVRVAVRLRVRRRDRGLDSGGLSYVDFLLPGIFVQSATFRATQTSVGLSQDLERGVIDRFRSMPMARSAVLVGRTLRTSFATS